jgi:hypothetical protein
MSAEGIAANVYNLSALHDVVGGVRTRQKWVNSISKSKVTRRRGADSTGSTASHADNVNLDLELE